MKIKLKQILEAVEPLKILLNKELPIKASYRLGRLKSAIESELNQFDTERQKLIKKYGREKDDGSYFVDESDKDNYDKFLTEINQLLDVDIEINYSPIDISIIDECRISPSNMSFLSVFFTDGVGETDNKKI